MHTYSCYALKYSLTPICHMGSHYICVSRRAFSALSLPYPDQILRLSLQCHSFLRHFQCETLSNLDQIDRQIPWDYAHCSNHP